MDLIEDKAPESLDQGVPVIFTEAASRII